jgi:glyoxylase-like metal-dependent hydrolase (beta-lactamase superfamily II)
VGGVKKIAEKTGCQVFLHPDELSLPPFITSGKLYYTDTYAEGDEITLAGMTFTVLHTPGHTPGAVCLHFGDHLFTGDTLFAGSCGRTDLPGGSFATIKASLKRLASLPGNASIYPGHGEETTLETERKNNPYIY